MNAVTNRALLAFVEESTLGGSLSSTALKRLRITGESLAHQATRQHSGQIEPDRSRVELMEIAMSAAGGIDFELSYTDYEALLRAVFCAGAGTADTPSAGKTRYVNGTTLKSFYFEKQFLDIAKFLGVWGGVFNELTLNFSANNPITGSFGILAQKTTKEATSRGASLVEPATDAVMRSGADVASITHGTDPIAAAIQSMSLTFRNNITPTNKLTSDTPAEFQLHEFSVSGSMTAYFPSMALYDDMRANTAKSLRVKALNAAGEIGIFIPAIKITGGTPVISGQNGDIMVEMPFVAEKGGAGVAFMAALELDPAG